MKVVYAGSALILALVIISTVQFTSCSEESEAPDISTMAPIPQVGDFTIDTSCVCPKINLIADSASHFRNRCLCWFTSPDSLIGAFALEGNLQFDTQWTE